MQDFGEEGVGSTLMIDERVYRVRVEDMRKRAKIFVVCVLIFYRLETKAINTNK